MCSSGITLVFKEIWKWNGSLHEQQKFERVAHEPHFIRFLFALSHSSRSRNRDRSQKTMFDCVLFRFLYQQMRFISQITNNNQPSFRTPNNTQKFVNQNHYFIFILFVDGFDRVYADDDNTMEVNREWRAWGDYEKIFRFSEWKMPKWLLVWMALFYYSKFSSCMRTEINEKREPHRDLS